MLATGRNDDLCTAVRFSMDTLAHKALEGGQATPAFTCYDCTAALGVVAAAEAAAPCIQVHPVLLSKLSARLWPGDEDDAHAASTALDQDRSRVVKTLPGTRAHYRNLCRRHRLTLSLHERCPEA